MSTPPSIRALRRALLRVDVGLLVGAFGLSLLGAILVWSSTRADSGTHFLIRHLFNAGVGIGLAVAVSFLHYQTLRNVAPVLYAAAIGGLIVVLSPVGTTVNGSHSWIQLPGGFSLQPAEFAKVALCLGLAIVLGEALDRHRRPSDLRVLFAWVLIGIPIALVMLQPDLGSALVLLALGLGTIALGGARLRWIVGAVAAGVIAVVAAMTTPVLSGYQRDRIAVFLNPSLDPAGIGYQVRQVRLAITAGGWQGQGLFAGAQTQGGRIPYQETDFVFSAAAEEFGFLGGALLLLVLAFVVFRILLVGARAPDAFGRLLAVGVAVWLTVQAFENVGMNLGILPVTGLPLPFISYGGSSMFACWLAIGLVNNTHMATRGANRRV